jgi:hypothetical protein
VIADGGTGNNVDAVVNNPANPAAPIANELYKVGGIAGLTVTPQEIVISFDTQIDPSTLTSQTVLLQESGGDGIFGNNNSANDKFINLSGKLTYSAATKQLFIHLADDNLSLPNDLYRVELLGDGANVIRDPEGNALDGENLDAAGNQRKLASGDGAPGGNFQMTFFVNNSPSSVVPGSLQLDPAVATVTNRGNFITKVNTPSFVGTITDKLPAISSLGGQTVFLDWAGPDGVFGTKDDVLNIGSAVTNATGGFNVKVGTDAANTGLVKFTGGLPDTPYNVGADGFLGINPNTGSFDDFNYSDVRVRVVDQSGNASSLTDPNAQTHFVVDTTGPKILSATPLPNSQATVASDGTIQVSMVVSENTNPATLNSSSIRVVRSGGDDVFGNGNDVPLAIGSSITVTPLLGTASGEEIVTFTIQNATVNDFYQVTLFGTGSNAITDIAGNALDGKFNGTFPTGTGTPGSDFNLDFIVFSPAFSHMLFVGQTVTNAAAKPGDRTNPFPTITAGINAANPGDVIAVLPGVYREQVKLKSLVRVLSADNASTDTSFVPGQALKTIIYTPATVTGQSVVVTADHTINLPQVQTEIAGFTIGNPLQGNLVSGTIDKNSVGVLANDAQVLIDKNYIINSGTGIAVTTSGAAAGTPMIEDNGLIGNINGIAIADAGSQSFLNAEPTQIINNDIAFNTEGLVVVANGPQQTVANVINNIFADNNSRTAPVSGAAIFASSPNHLTVQFNMFAGNGVNPNSPSDDTLGVGGGFDPTILSSTPDQFGNITGNPGFVNPRDPRGGFDGPANFFSDANFDLTTVSDAIDNGLNSSAPSLDFLYRSRVKIPGRGHAGPADIGAFEYKGLFGITVQSGLSTRAAGNAFTNAFGIPASAIDTFLGSNGQTAGNVTVSNGLDFATHSSGSVASQTTPITPPPAATPIAPVKQGPAHKPAKGHAHPHAPAKPKARPFHIRNLFRKHSARG